MDEGDYKSVVEHMHTEKGLMFGLPIVLDTDREDIKARARMPPAAAPLASAAAAAHCCMQPLPTGAQNKRTSRLATH